MLELILSSIQSIVQVILVVFIGTLLTSYGHIENDQQKWLSRLNILFFTPCLLFSNISSVLSFEKLLDFWPVPVFYIAFMLSSWILCQIFMPLFCIEKYYKNFVLACVLFTNTNSLPVAIFSGLAVSESGKSLYRDPDDSQATIAVRWSYGFRLLRSPEIHQPVYGTIQIENKPPKFSQILQSIHRRISPPLYAALLALVVGLCSPIKKILYGPIFYVSVVHAVESCGRASVPIMLVCLGAQLKLISQHPAGSDRALGLVLLIRILLCPVCLGLVVLFARSDQVLAKDPVFLVSIVIAGCMPTSINLTQITQANRAFGDEMVYVLFWSYGVACVPICTLAVFAGLYIAIHLT